MVRSKRARTWWIALAAVIVLAVLFVPTMQLLYMRFPELFGNHDFSRAPFPFLNNPN
jgi:hypothetical protein